MYAQVMWLRPREGMTGLEEHFDREDSGSFRFLPDPSRGGKPVTGETLTLPRTNSQFSLRGKKAEEGDFLDSGSIKWVGWGSMWRVGSTSGVACGG